ncbi:MAG: GTP cyclohydrolase 1 type 2 [Firmicutes bacterium]|nr:GTP cyclohydrolase 1 type 2 [candidate division NPL-UPA2 bacterium]
MSVSVKQVVSVIEDLAPLRLAEEWDNVGLLVGSYGNSVNRVLLALDVTEEAVDWALAVGCDLIIAHHPVIFRPLKALRTDLPQGRILEKLIRSGLSVYAAHTNWDKCHSGTSRRLAELLGLSNVSVLKTMGQSKNYKLVVFVPESHRDAVFQAMAAEGAGHIGDYSHCSFYAQGKGTFMPRAGAQPYLGRVDELAHVEEVRLEVVVPEQKLPMVLKGLRAAHPYEEAAYDVIELHNAGLVYGLGCIGELTPPLAWPEFSSLLRNLFPAARVAGRMPAEVHKVAVCGGAGAELLHLAHATKAEVLVTGDVGHHHALEAEALGMAVVDAGHYATEAFLLQDWHTLLTKFAHSKQLPLEFHIFSPKRSLFSDLHLTRTNAIM